MLTTLPPEIFRIIAENLSRSDLKSLSSVSRRARELSANTLWRSLVLKPLIVSKIHDIRTAGIPQQLYQLATECHFRLNSQSAVDCRCPHAYDESNSGDNPELKDMKAKCADDWGENDDEYRDQPHFDRVAQRARLVLSRFADDQLRSFSWSLGTCIPPEILGRNGIVALHQSRRLRSLHLITHPLCLDKRDDYDTEVDLSTLRQLRSLSWKAPGLENLKTLSVALRCNSIHLRELDLDFVNWEPFRVMLDSYDSDGKKVSYSLRNILGIDERSPAPYFPDIRVLSLTQVPVTTPMMAVANLNTLESLTLRQCPGSVEPFLQVVGQTTTIRLRRLEFRPAAGDDTYPSRIRDFIQSFIGLEELFVHERWPQSSFQLWHCAARHQSTLRKLVYHQRTSYLGDETDIDDLNILPFEKMALEYDHPFSKLDLQCLGLSCDPGKLLKRILQPFRTKDSLELLHIRETHEDMSHYSSLGLQASFLDYGGIPGLEGRNPNGGGFDQARALRGLQRRLREFLEWVFGPDGLPSLQVVAFGDFAVIDAFSKYNVIVCRDVNEATNFRIVGPSQPTMGRILSEYRDVLGACPSRSSIRIKRS